MKTKNIFNYVFLIGLFLLILNDHFLKYEFGNWFTGKLSDFAGILIFPMFLKWLFPVDTKKSVLFTILLFVFWKSPYSQFLIDTFNSFELISMSRVVDYTDFVAFLILPFSVYVLRHLESFKLDLKNNFANQIATNSLLILTIATFLASQTEDDIIPNVGFNCCELEPIEAKVGAGNIFIPNVFTPDGDGINDFFQISADANILRIDTFIVTSNRGGSTFFSETNITNIIPENGFDGVINDTIVPTLFRFEIIVTSVDSVRERFIGEICCLPCQSPLGIPAPRNLENCAFSTQYDEMNGYDENIDSGEVLDCFD